MVEIFDSIGRNRKKNDSLLLMVTKEHLAVSSCLQRAFHSFLSMFFQNISMALVKYPDVLRKIVQKLFGLWASFVFFSKEVCLFSWENPFLSAGISVRYCHLLVKKIV